MEHQNYCLKWKKQMEHLQSALAGYLDRQIFCDVSLASEDQVFSAHQFVLSACSPYFENIFNKLPTNKHPVIFLNDVSFLEIQILINYMYKGQTVVSEDLLPAFLKTCERLQIQGLCSTSRNTNNQKNAGLQKAKPSHAERVNQVVFETNSLDGLNQERRSTKRKTNALEQGSANNVQSTSENNDQNQSVFKTNKLLRQTQFINRNSKSLSGKEKRQIEQMGSPSCKQTKHTHVTPEKFPSKQLVLQENSSLLFPSADMPDVTMDNINDDFRPSNTINQSDVLTSPPDSQESFIFNTNFFKSLELQPTNVSFKSIIIQEDNIEISDSGTNRIKYTETEKCFVENKNSPTSVGHGTDMSESMMVQLDKNSQKDIADYQEHASSIVPSDNVNKNQECDSDESEIIMRSKSKCLNKNLISCSDNSSDETSNESRALTRSSRRKQQTKNTREGTKRTSCLKTEALNRAKAMRVIIGKK